MERKMTIAVESQSQHSGEGDGNAGGGGRNSRAVSLSAESTTTTSEDENEALLRFPVSFLICITIIWILLCAWFFLYWEETWNYGGYTIIHTNNPYKDLTTAVESLNKYNGRRDKTSRYFVRY
jgi:hypothetical protein